MLSPRTPGTYVCNDGTKYHIHADSQKIYPELIKIYVYLEPEHGLIASPPFDMSGFGMPNEAKFNLKYRQCYIVIVHPGTVVCLGRDNKKYVILGNRATMHIESPKYDDASIVIENDTFIKVNNMDIRTDQLISVKLDHEYRVLIPDGVILECLDDNFRMELLSHADAYLVPSLVVPVREITSNDNKLSTVSAKL